MPSSMTNRQIVFYIFSVCTATSTVTLPQVLALSAGRGAWVTLLLTSLIFGGMIVVIIKLNKMHGGKTLPDYSREIAGRFIPYILCVIYVLYFLAFDMEACHTLAQMVHAHFLLETPPWILILVIMPVLAFIAYKGVNKAARLAEIFLIWFLIMSVIIFVTMLFQGDWRYLLPLFNPSKTGEYIFSVKDAFFAFLGISVLTVVPMDKKNKKAPKALFFTMIAIGVFYILDVYGCYAVLGLDEIVYHSYPLVDAIRLVEYKAIEFFQRVDILYMTFGFIRIFMGKAIVYLTIVEFVCKMLPKAKRIVVVLSAGVIIYLASVLTLDIKDISKILRAVLGYGGVVASFLIPLALFITAKVKKHGKKSA